MDRICPLCRSSEAAAFFQDKRDYFRCHLCLLVFVPPHQFLPSEEEKGLYDLHENTPEDARYRQFLQRLYGPVSERLAPGSSGLDFGSGPGPTLSVMFEEAGHSMGLFDVFYSPDMSAFERQYDFITATEVLEHLHKPHEELQRLWTCLKPDGLLGIMTKRVTDRKAFSKWHYKNDPTHVCFFSTQTFQWWAAHWGARLTVVDDDVVLLEKPA
jgi:SAM-dependent methyltransferase